MACACRAGLTAVLFLLLAGLAAASAATFISADVLQSRAGSTGRSLLQARRPCPVNFEFMNYTIITSKCKGPQYPAQACCSAFKEFACPYRDDLNDGTNECASTMFSYINLYGRYPPGLFASECKEGKLGLECPADAPGSVDDSANIGILSRSISFLVVLLITGLTVACLVY